MGDPSTFQNIRVYCPSPPVRLVTPSQLTRGVFAGLAFVVYWGIVLFGYDT